MKTTPLAQHTVVGSFGTRSQAQDAVAELRRLGFRDDQVGLVTRSATNNNPDAVDNTGMPDNLGDDTNWERNAGMGAAAGAMTGTGLGLAIAAGLIPAIGPVIAGGTLAALIASAGAGAAAGGILGAFVGLGISDDDAKFSEEELNAGRTIVTVAAHGRYAEAAEVLNRFGALERDAVVTTSTPNRPLY
jgi:hypothetical protein